MDSFKDEETLFVGTAEAEHVEMYLKADMAPQGARPECHHHKHCQDAQHQAAKRGADAQKTKRQASCTVSQGGGQSDKRRRGDWRKA